MRRRAWVLLVLVAGAPAGASSREHVPTTEESLNRFAMRYNAYVESLRKGVIDLAAWEKAKQEWRGLTGQ